MMKAKRSYRIWLLTLAVLLVVSSVCFTGCSNPGVQIETPTGEQFSTEASTSSTEESTNNTEVETTEPETTEPETTEPDPTEPDPTEPETTEPDPTTNGDPVCEHSYGQWTVTVNPTCSTTGKKESICTLCNAVKAEAIAKLPHTEVTDAAVEATCAVAGKTAGKHCSVCGEVTLAQETVAKKPHTEVTQPAVAATCAATGKTAGKYCSVCGEVTLAQETVAKKPHTEVTQPAVAATCTADGKTAGKYCSVCNEVLVKQTVVKATGHHFSELRIDFPGWDTEGARSLACKNCNDAQSDSILPLSQSLYGYKEFGTHTKGAALQSLYRQLYDLCDAFAKSRVNETDGIIGTVDFSDSGLTTEQVLSIYFTFFEENGQFYWLSNTLTVEGTRFNVCIAEDYYAVTTRDKFDQDITAMVQDAVARISADMTDFERALALHDYILEKINYAYIPGTNTPETASWAHSIVGVSSKGKGVCESYAKTFALLCRLNGVDCMPVWGDAGGAHMWNLVKINGTWYVADLTWDDMNVDQAYRSVYFGMSESRSAKEREKYSNVYGAEYCYALPQVSTKDLQALELFENGKSKGFYYGLDTAFAAMTSKNSEYILDLFLDYYLIESASTPSVKSITLDGNLRIWGEDQWIDVTTLAFDGNVKLNGDLTINNINLMATDASVTLDLNGKTLTTGGHYCKAECLTVLGESGYDILLVHISSGTKANPTGKLVIKTTYQTEIYSELCVAVVEGNGGSSNELSLRNSAVIGTVKNLGSLRCPPYFDSCHISIGSLECYSCYFGSDGSTSATFTVDTIKYLAYPGSDGTLLNSILLHHINSMEITGSIEHPVGIIMECNSLEDLKGKPLFRLATPALMDQIIIEFLTYTEQSNITNRCAVDASGNVTFVG